jgi:flagellar protein FliT
MMASIRLMPSQIELYEEISTLSSRMVAAAQANDWDALIDLERGVAGLRDTLMTADDIGSSPLDLDRKRTLIQRILQDDAEVRRHTEPWMEQVRTFLGTANRRQQVERAYGGTGSLGGAR